MEELPTNRTKIVATIGPASLEGERLESMIRAGMNIARLNFSHGDFDTHGQIIDRIRRATETTGETVAIMADLPGPKIRLGEFSDEPVQLEQGNRFVLTTEDVAGDAERVSVNFDRLPDVVEPKNLIAVNDGYIQLEVDRIEGRNVECIVRVGGELGSRKGVNLPGIDLGISAFTPRDRECLAFALEHGVDAVSQSFVQNADDLRAVREAARELGHDPFLIAKIERARALDHFDDILEAADGIMIARGDLGVEIPIEQIAVVQKDITRRANRKAKPVITATQMLESMISSRLPTRAEATDVANSILDGTDAVMLSAESAIGDYPVESVSMLARIASAVEPTRRRTSAEPPYTDAAPDEALHPEHLIALSVDAVLQYRKPAAIFVPSASGATARWIAALHLPVPVIAIASRLETCRCLQFSYGVTAVHEPEPPKAWNKYVRSWLKQHDVPGDFAFLTHREPADNPKGNHRMEIIRL